MGQADQIQRILRGLVVCPQPQAASVGTEVLAAGGNAVDAALATAFAQGVVDPHMGGIGGFGCMLLRSAETGEVTTISFHGRAGSRATADLFTSRVLGKVEGHAERYLIEGSANQVGYESVVVPGVVAGFYRAHQMFGRLPWRDLLAPAIRIAREGFIVLGDRYRAWAEPTAPGHEPSLVRFSATPASAAIFLKDGELSALGSVIVQNDYAATLQAIADEGPDIFYKGEIARAIAKDFEANGGLLSYDDLAGYEPTVEPPVKGHYRGHEVLSMAPPASGVQVIQILQMLDRLRLSDQPHGSPDHVAQMSDVMQLTFDDRYRYLGDPKFVDVPVDMLVDPDFAEKRLAEMPRLNRGEGAPSQGNESSDTTHVCATDAQGNAVSLTHTLGSASGVVVPGLGFTFNNCMYQFDPIPGRPNSIAPGKARITGLSPTLLLKDGKPVLLSGAPGGTHIVGAVVHSIVNCIEFGMTAVESVSAPRFHAEAGYIEVEPRLYFDVQRELEARGYPLRLLRYSHDRSLAAAHVIFWPAQYGLRWTPEGGADPRAGNGVSRLWGDAGGVKGVLR